MDIRNRMNRRNAAHIFLPTRIVAGFLLVVLLFVAEDLAGLQSSFAQVAITATQDQATLTFPESINFSVELRSQAEIDQVVLEYWVEQQTCGQVTAKAYPDFTPGKIVTTTWTWEMKQSGSEPPGSKIHWRWRVTDAAGSELLTDEQMVVWLDNQHSWQTLSGDHINLHWYSGTNSFGKELFDAAVDALANLENLIGLKAEAPIDLYIYANTDDMLEAIYYEPGWTGGVSFIEYGIIIIGISPSELEWGKSTEAHELTHALVGHFTFSCLGFIPNWIVEGIAVYGEGGLDEATQSRFDTAIADDTLLSVQILSSQFSENTDRVDISYSESYSLVNFLIEKYGKDQFMALLVALREGATIDDALQVVYGFDANGLEDAWRVAVGAQPRATTEGATATPLPTRVPTIVPISGALLAPTTAFTRTPLPTTNTRTETPQKYLDTSTPTLRATKPVATREAPTATARPVKATATKVPTATPTSSSGRSSLGRIASSLGLVCVIVVGVLLTFIFTIFGRPRRRRQA